MHCMYTFTLPVGWTCRLVIRFLNLVLDPWWWSYLVIGRSAGRLCDYGSSEVYCKYVSSTCIGHSVVNVSLE